MAADCSGAATPGQPGATRGTALFVRIPLGGEPRAGISLARAGDMDLAKRESLPWRAGLFAALGVGPERVRSVHQVHSRTVVKIDGSESPDGPFPDADGMVTDRSDLLLAITVADCLPIFIVDRRTGAIGIVHSGWKGTGIVVEAIRLMRTAYGTRIADLAVTIGPGIGPCCYTVPAERHREFGSRFGATAAPRGPDGRLALDLWAANVSLLEGEGLEEVAVVRDCTSCNPRFGSYRREGAAAFTRMLAFVGAGTGGMG